PVSRRQEDSLQEDSLQENSLQEDSLQENSLQEELWINRFLEELVSDQRSEALLRRWRLGPWKEEPGPGEPQRQREEAFPEEDEAYHDEAAQWPEFVAPPWY